MSKITDIIFKGEYHYITSSFGSREPIKTNAGTTSNVHKGTDYGTRAKKIPQYAIEDGKVVAVGKDSAGAKYVKVEYPRIKKRFHHWHLDTISVEKGQVVKKYTKLGTTGMTGKATGIHLHLAIIDLETDCYIDPEEYAKTYKVPCETFNKKTNEEIAKEVIQGKWGNGKERKEKLQQAGYDYNAIQKLVNSMVNKKPTNKKTNEEIAKEVIQGKWGNGKERKEKLQQAGYNYNTIQKLVNKMIKK